MLVAKWMLCGLIAGLIAKIITPGRYRSSLGLLILSGLAGGILGGLIGRTLFYAGGRVGSGGVVNSPDPVWELPMAAAGAVIALGLYIFIVNKPRRV